MLLILINSKVANHIDIMYMDQNCQAKYCNTNKELRQQALPTINRVFSSVYLTFS